MGRPAAPAVKAVNAIRAIGSHLNAKTVPIESVKAGIEPTHNAGSMHGLMLAREALFIGMQRQFCKGRPLLAVPCAAQKCPHSFALPALSPFTGRRVVTTPAPPASSCTHRPSSTLWRRGTVRHTSIRARCCCCRPPGTPCQSAAAIHRDTP